MATEEGCAAAEVMRSLARHVNCLNGDEKNTRKRALENIKRETIDRGLSSDVLQEVFACLLKSLVRCLSDPMERCREVAIEIIGDFIRCVSKPESSLPYIIPCLVQRLGGKEREPAEELRLSMVEVLSLIVEVCGTHLTPYLDDIVQILQKTLTDPFPDVIKESCECTVHFAQSIPGRTSGKYTGYFWLEMATEEGCAAAEVMRSLARHENCLNGDEKNTRKRALENIKRETIDRGLSSDVLQEVFACLLKSLVRCLSDPMERCREVAIEIIGDFIRCVSKPESSLPYIIPCLVQRLGGKEREPAEELRLSMVEVLSLIVEVCGTHLTPYLDDIVQILQKTLTDPFPDVIKESCECTVHFAQSIPDHFHMKAESLVKPLMQNISHNHSRVRKAITEATGAVVRYGTGKTMEDVLSHMAQRLFDNSPQVRKAVTQVVGDWLLNLPDRYSYFHKLIPLLLSSLSDDLPEIRALACELWRQVGDQWEKENEDDLKDKLNFLSPTLPYPPGVDRPGLGCRELVVRNLSKLMPALRRDANDWLEQTRVKTMQLLHVLLLHAEDHCTQYLQQLLATLYHACGDSEKDVRTNALASARLLGVFVSPEVFIKLLLAHVQSPSACSFSSPWAPLMVLAEVLKGRNRKLPGPQLLQLGQTLAHPDVCQESQQAIYVKQLLACVEILLEVCEEDCSIISLLLLKVLVTVQCVSTEPEIQSKAEKCVLHLCQVLNLRSVHELYRQHMAELLQWLLTTVNSWSTYSIQKTQLEIITLESGPVVGEFLPDLIPLLKSCLMPSQDPVMRLHIFAMLSKLLLNSRDTLDSQGKFSQYLEVFLNELLLPNLVWHAGHAAAAVRTSALSCLLAMLQGGTLSREQVLSMDKKFSTYLISALEEDSQLSRLLACRAVSSLMTITKRCLNPDTLNKIYPELLKRIDDNSQEVRAEALKALRVWFSSLDKQYDRHTNSSHLEFLFQHLLLYLDDPDPQVQPMVLEVLKAGSVADPILLKQKVEEVRGKQRNTEYCDQLLQYIQSL